MTRYGLLLLVAVALAALPCAQSNAVEATSLLSTSERITSSRGSAPGTIVTGGGSIGKSISNAIAGFIFGILLICCCPFFVGWNEKRHVIKLKQLAVCEV